MTTNKSKINLQFHNSQYLCYFYKWRMEFHSQIFKYNWSFKSMFQAVSTIYNDSTLPAYSRKQIFLLLLCSFTISQTFRNWVAVTIRLFYEHLDVIPTPLGKDYPTHTRCPQNPNNHRPSRKVKKTKVRPDRFVIVLKNRHTIYNWMGRKET